MQQRGAWLCFVVALAVYWIAQGLHTGAAFAQSGWPYYVYYARALLDGQLHFGALPPAALDLAFHQGRYYLYHPPFPALLLAPWVALQGLGTPDRFAGVLLGAANGALFHRLLGALEREGVARSQPRERLLLSALFLFGTVHFYLAVTANHWELSQIVVIGAVLLGLLAALDGRPTLAALCAVAALWTRSHVVLVSVGFAWLYLWREQRRGHAPRERWRALLPGALLLAAGVACLLAFNAARFGDPFESGTGYQRMHEMFRADFERHGLFAFHYLPRNLYALLLATPALSEDFPFLRLSPHGLSLFLATPFYLFLLHSLRRETRAQAWRLWAGAAPVLVPVLLTIGTGALQFGHRYSADVQPLLLPLAWLGAGQRFTRAGMVLWALSLLTSRDGAWWFVAHYAQ